MLIAQTKGNQHGNEQQKSKEQLQSNSKPGKIVDALLNVLNQELQETDEHKHECDATCTHDQTHKHDANEHEHDHEQAVCAHDANIKSLMMESIGKCVDLEAVDNWLSELLWSDQYQTSTNNGNENKENEVNTDKQCMEIFRMKAVLPVSNGDNHYLSAVQDLYEIEKGNVRWMNESNDITQAQASNCLCKMVVIGKLLDEPLLRKGFESIFVDDTD